MRRMLQLFPILILTMGISCPTPHAVVITWQVPPEYSRFILYRSTDGVTFSQLATVVGDTYIDKAVQLNTTYYYKAKTVCDLCAPDTSVFSNVVSIQK